MFRPTLSQPTGKVRLAHGKTNRMVPQNFTPSSISVPPNVFSGSSILLH